MERGDKILNIVLIVFLLVLSLISGAFFFTGFSWGVLFPFSLLTLILSIVSITQKKSNKQIRKGSYFVISIFLIFILILLFGGIYLRHATIILLILFFIQLLIGMFFYILGLKKESSKKSFNKGRNIIIAVFVFFIIFFVVLPSLEFVVFNFQCSTRGCGGGVCSAKPFANDLVVTLCTLAWNPEFACYKDCRVRDFKCSFDEKFKQNCLDCIEDCRINVNQSDPQYIKVLMDCKANCSK
jgi:hypothetical protein